MKNEIRIEDNIAFVKVVRRDGTELEYMFDPEDIEKFQGRTLSSLSKKKLYGIIVVKQKRLFAHHIVMDFIPDPEGRLCVDHVNGNIFDNRKENLRVVDRLVNQQNINKAISNTGHVGISISMGRFLTSLTREYARVSKRFDTLEEAIEFRKYLKELPIEEFKELSRQVT
jgi:hypothetical protein